MKRVPITDTASHDLAADFHIQSLCVYEEPLEEEFQVIPLTE